MPRSLKLLGVAALFALCGALSASLPMWAEHSLDAWGAPDFLKNDVLFALPFALLCAALFLRTWRAILSLPLNVIVWHFAAWIAGEAATRIEGGFWILLAGLVGGLGVALADSICRPTLLHPKRLAGSALIGALAALPFWGWNAGPGSPAWAWTLSFAIWQASVGTYLFWVCSPGQQAVRQATAEQAHEES